jgi:hypothetical protein
LHDKIKREIEGINGELTAKIKKRLKLKDLTSDLDNKVNIAEFMKQIERLDNNMTVFGD